MNNLNVGILGATGAVGQKFIRLLENHPWFTVQVLGASSRSAGKAYKEAAHWIEGTEMPADVAKMTVSECKPEDFTDIDFVFSGLDSSVAESIERSFAEAGIPVISNAKNYRMDEHVPLLVPEINPDHAELIELQSFSDDGSGWIVTNPNCVCVPLAISLKPLYDVFEIEAVMATALQSVSGAGYPGESSMDMIGNVVPYIGGEEDKVVTEPLKILGSLSNDTIETADFDIQATSMRVPTIAGHLLSISVQPARSPAIDEVTEAVEQWDNPIASLDLPSAPDQLFKIYEEKHHPQPRLHAERAGGMQVGLGRFRSGPLFDINYTALAHNTIRGAAGGAVLNAELLAEKGHLS